MLTENGRVVLQMMLSAASGHARPSGYTVAQIARVLPWLTAHDRRDAMTIKLALDDIERRIEQELEVLQSEKATGFLGRQVTSLLARDYSGRARPTFASEREHSMTKRRQNEALAVSLFVHASILPGEGDPTHNESVRSWLKQVGISLPEGGALESLDSVPYPRGEQRQRASVMEEQRASELEHQRAAAKPEQQRASDLEHGAEGGVPLVTAPLRATMTGSDVQSYGWKLVSGVHDFADTPVGRFALQTRSPPVQARGELHGDETGSVEPSLTPAAGMPGAFLLDLPRGLAVPVVSDLTCILFVGLTMLYEFQIVSTIYASYRCLSFAESPIGSVPNVTGSLCTTLLNIFWAVMIALLMLRKVQADCLSDRFPVPARCTGKVEYALAWAFVASSQLTTLLDKTRYHSYPVWDGSEDEPEAKPGEMTFYGTIVANLLLAVLIAVTSSYEIILALRAALAATWRARDLRLMFEFTEAWVHSTRTFA